METEIKTCMERKIISLLLGKKTSRGIEIKFSFREILDVRETEIITRRVIKSHTGKDERERE